MSGRGGGTCRPPGDDDGEDARPDGHERHGDEHGRRDRAHQVRPHARAVHDALPPRQLALEQRAVPVGEDHLEVPARRTRRPLGCMHTAPREAPGEAGCLMPWRQAHSIWRWCLAGRWPCGLQERGRDLSLNQSRPWRSYTSKRGRACNSVNAQTRPVGRCAAGSCIAVLLEAAC